MIVASASRASEKWSKTPEDLVITPRDRRFGRSRETARWWHSGRPHRTAIFNALSATFPRGEAFFVESVRRFRDRADPRLAEEIRAFALQEAIHSREHLAFNRRAIEAGYDLTPLEKRVEQRLRLLDGKAPEISLAATMVLEHFTAMLAHALLADPALLEGADNESARMWRWHAVEEIEHKGVAYDTWLAATDHWPRFRRWFIRANVMLHVTRNFVVDRTAGTLELLRQDGITGLRAWGPLFWEMWGRPGIMRKILPAWLHFFVPGFHPWSRDDRYLCAAEPLGVRHGA